MLKDSSGRDVNHLFGVNLTVEAIPGVGANQTHWALLNANTIPFLSNISTLTKEVIIRSRHHSWLFSQSQDLWKKTCDSKDALRLKSGDEL
jgi:hypothetical protein